MSQDRFQHVMALFEEALALPTDEQSSFLDERCGGDDSLRAEVVALLACDASPATSLKSAGGGVRLLAEQIGSSRVIEAEAPGSVLPTLAGHYRVIRVIGEGGMGTVYEAEQSRPRRTVALKAIRPGLVSRQMLKRLEREAEMLGRLQHPGIAQVYEAGAADSTREDQAFFSMEFVRGLPLTTHCEQNRLDLRQRAELIAKVCDAVQHAHERRVIHRDLKPGNILVDGTGQPKILDFGVARVLDRDGAMATVHTMAGQLVGTLPYMSPEQVGPNPDTVDARSDVYAIGVLLYQLATGVLPHDLANVPITEAARIIKDVAPRRPSSINPRVKGDLETIICRALEKEAARRYHSAAAVADDLRRWLQGLPIAAKEDSALYVLGKQVKRHRTAVIVIVGAFLSLIAFSTFSTIQSRRNALLAAAAEKARAEADRERLSAERQLRASDIERGRLLGITGNMSGAETLIWNAQNREETRQSRWALWELYSKYPCVLTLQADDNPVRWASMSRDQKTIATIAVDSSLKLWDARTGQVKQLIGPETKPVTAILSDDGTTVVTGGIDGQLREWDALTGIQRRALKLEGGRFLTLKEVGPRRLLAIGTDVGVVHLVNPITLALERTLEGSRQVVRSIAADAAGRMIAMGDDGGKVHIWNSETGQLLANFGAHTGLVGAIAMTDDGKMLATGGVDRVLNLWNLSDTGEPSTPTPIEWTNGWVRSLQFTHDGKNLLSAGFWRVEVWDTATRKLAAEMTQIEQPPWIASFSPDEQYILTGAENGTVRMWESKSLSALKTTMMHPGGASALAVSWDGTAVVSGGTTDGRVSLSEKSPHALTPSIQVDAHIGRVWSVAFIGTSAESRRIATAGADGAVRLWDMTTGTPIAVVRPPGPDPAVSLAFDRVNGRLAASTRNGHIVFFDGPDLKGRAYTRPKGATNEVLKVEFNPDGTSLAATRRTKSIEFYDPISGTLQWRAETDAPVWSIKFIRGTDLFVIGTWDSGLEVWNQATRSRVSKLSGHTQVVTALDWQPAEHGHEPLLASSSADGTIKLWDLTESACLATLRPGRGAVNSVQFAHGQNTIMSAHADGTVGVWDLAYYNSHTQAQARLHPATAK